MDANRLEFTEENLDQCKDYLLGWGEKKYWWFDHCKLNTANEVIWKENELLIIPREHIDLLLQSIYKDPKETGGRDRIYQYIKENFVGVSRRRIMEFLQNQESYQLQFREKKPRITTPIFSSEWMANGKQISSIFRNTMREDSNGYSLW